MTITPKHAKAVMVHDLALCESTHVGEGTRIWAFAHIMNGAIVGEGCNIGGHAFIESGARVGNRVTVKNGVMIWDKVTIEDDVFLGPGAIFTNDPTPRSAFKKPPDRFVSTIVKCGATIGAGAVIVCGTHIGHNSFIGAGTVVVGDVPAHALVVGNPGKQKGWVCTCGLKLDDSLTCTCGRTFRKRETGLEEKT